MYLVRETMHCKPGKAGEIVKKFKEVGTVLVDMGYKPLRVMTDVSGGRFWTVIAEQEVEDLNEFVELARDPMAEARLGTIMKGYHDLVESGGREIYKIE